jgi:hypothetical protein
MILVSIKKLFYLRCVWERGVNRVPSNFILFLLKIIFVMFSDCFDVLILKIIF